MGVHLERAVLAPSAAPLCRVKLVSRGSHFGSLGPMTFALLVVLGEGQSHHVVHRRYSCFLRLDSALREHFPNLPAMPPKGRLRRLRPGFMAERMRRLGELISAAVKADPRLSLAELSDFLGLPPLRSASAPHGLMDANDSFEEISPERGFSDPCLSFRVRDLSTILESEYDPSSKTPTSCRVAAH